MSVSTTQAPPAPRGEEPAQPQQGGLPRVATAIAVASWGLAVVAVVLLVSARPVIDENLWFFFVDVTVACIYGTVTAVILARRAHPVPWLLGLAALGGGLASFGYAWGEASAGPGGLPYVEAVARLASTAWMPGTLSLFLVVPWLVRDHPLGREAWGLLVGVVALVGTAVAAVAVHESFFVLLAASVVMGVVTAGAVERRHRTGPVEERNGLGWLALGTLILAVSFAPLLLPWGTLPMWSTPVLHLASQAVYPAAVLVVVLRNRLWGLRLVVSRAVLAGVLTAALLGVYLLVTLALTAVLPGDGLPQLVGAGVLATAVQPLRLWLARRVHRLVYGDAADSARVVRRLGSQLVGDATVEELLGGLTRDIGRSMRLESVVVAAEGLPRLGWGEPTGPTTAVDLQHRGTAVGRLEVSPVPGESLSARDLVTLADLSSVVAAAVAVARAAADVDDLRGRLAHARLEERRVIRREVHDGLGPALAGIRLGLHGARNLLDTDPAAGRELLDRLQDEVDTAVTAVRTLSHHLLPPVLDELGLGPALAELAQRYADSGVEVVVDTEQLATLDHPTAAAAYGIVSEATSNVLRHAGARHCWVAAASTAEGLVLTVADDGHGLPARPVPGVGTASMRERAAEQGGSLEVGPRPGGGTVVRALLPGGADG